MLKANRLEKVTDNMKKHNVDQILISSPSSIFYLTGKYIDPGERLFVLYINIDMKVKLFINELFPVGDFTGIDKIVHKDGDDPISALCSFIDAKKTLGIDKFWPSGFLINLLEKKPAIKIVNSSSIVDEARMIKDDEEIELMRKASKANDAAISDIIKLIPEKHSEIKMCRILADIYSKYDTPSFSFSPLVEYGENAADPHHNSDSTMIKDGDCVLIDIGGRTNNYCSDMTRTVFYKEPCDECKKIYNIVLEANIKAIDSVKPGIRFCDIDAAARNVITKAGYGKYFTHRTGHNIGIDDHEYPDVGSYNDMIVKEGMIFSIEPGIYLKGKYGVRIEDLVLVTKNGCEVLNKYPKELKIL